MKNKELNENSPESCKEQNHFQIFNGILSVIAIVVSIVSLYVTTSTSKTLLDYQIEQERLPQIVTLNQELSLSFSIKKNDDIVDFTSFSEDTHTIEIPIYNIGVGTAQNCTLEWETESIKTVYRKLISSLNEKDSSLINEFTYSDNDSSFSIYHTYNFEIEDEELNSLLYWDAENSDYIKEELYTETFRYPYILPITNSEPEICISLPDALSTILIEAANQEVDESIIINLQVKYEDLSGKEYEKLLQLTFSLDKRVELENHVNCVYLISVTEI